MIRSVLLAAAGSLALLGFAAAAPDSDEATVFVTTLVEDLSAAAGNDAVSESARVSEQRAILQNELAVDRIGKFLFSGAPAEAATPAQKARYDELFPSYIAAAFADQMGELAGRDIQVSKIVPRGDDEALAQSKLVNTAGVPKANIDWRVTWIDGKPYLLDVIVERVSPLVTKRQEFSALVRREGVDALLKHMETTVGRS